MKYLILIICFSACTPVKDYSIHEDVLQVPEGTENFTPNLWQGKTFTPVCEEECDQGAIDTIEKYNELVPGIFSFGAEITFSLATKEELKSISSRLGRNPADNIIGTSEPIFESGVLVSCNVYAWDELPLTSNVFAHEVGHCLGFSHSENVESIMFSSAGHSFTSEMVDFLQKEYGAI